MDQQNYFNRLTSKTSKSLRRSIQDRPWKLLKSQISRWKFASVSTWYDKNIHICWALKEKDTYINSDLQDHLNNSQSAVKKPQVHSSYQNILKFNVINKYMSPCKALLLPRCLSPAGESPKTYSARLLLCNHSLKTRGMPDNFFMWLN